MQRTPDEWVQLFKDLNTFWRHDGNPRRPHALLTNGGHSNGFFNWSAAAEDPSLVMEVTDQLIITLKEQHPAILKETQRFVGPACGAVTLADHMAMAATRSHGGRCLSGFLEKKEGNFVARQNVMGQFIVATEDTITSGDSVGKGIKTLEDEGATVAPIIVCVCNRSGLESIGGRPIVSLITTPMENWDPNACKLCPTGSKAMRAKGPNWILLNQEYPAAA